jgi:hypothetical protein
MRAQGTRDSEEARHVLFYTIRPEYVDMASEEEGGEDEDEVYHPDVQIHAAYLLAQLPAQDEPLTRRVKKMYEDSGYDLTLHLP